MHQRSNSLSKSTNPQKRESITFAILNTDKKFKEKSTSIIVKTNDEFAFHNESKLQIQVVINNKMFGSISFKPKIINKIPNSTQKWITLFDPNDDFYDGDFVDDDFDEPKVKFQFNRIQSLEDKYSQEVGLISQQAENQQVDQGGQSKRGCVFREANGEQKTNRASSKDSSSISCQQNLKNVFKQSFSMKLMNEELNDQINNKEECLKKMQEKLNTYKQKLEFKEKENGVLSHNIQKVQMQYNDIQKLMAEDQIKSQQQEKSMKKAESKIQKLTDYLIDLKEKHQQLSIENENYLQKIKEYEEKQMNIENQEYYQDQLEKKRLIIENLRLQIQEFQESELQKETIISELQQSVQSERQKILELEKQHLEQMKESDLEKSQKIELLLEQVNSQKKQAESLSDQVKVILEDHNSLKLQVEEKNNIIRGKENKELLLVEQIKKQKQDIEDQLVQIEEQNNHIKNQAKQINEQNQQILKYKQTCEQQKDKADKEAAQRTQSMNENKKITQMFLEQKQKLIEIQNENKKLLTSIKEKDNKILTLEKEKVFKSIELEQKNNINNGQDRNSGNNCSDQQFWQKIPIKIADLEKDMADYDQKHILHQANQDSNFNQQNQPADTPTIGMLAMNLEESLQTDQYFINSDCAKQCQQPNPVTPFLQLLNNSNQKQDKSQTKREETNIPIKLSNYHLMVQKQSNSFAHSSPFSTLTFSEDPLALDHPTSLLSEQIKYIKPQLSLLKHENAALKSLQNSQKKVEKENTSQLLDEKEFNKNELSISEYRNKRYQLRISQPTFVSNQSTTKSLDSQNQAITISNIPNQSQKSLQNSDAPSPIFKSTSQTQLTNSGFKSKRSTSITQLSDNKKQTITLSSSKKRTNTSLEIKKWKI